MVNGRAVYSSKASGCHGDLAGMFDRSVTASFWLGTADTRLRSTSHPATLVLWIVDAHRVRAELTQDEGPS